MATIAKRLANQPGVLGRPFGLANLPGFLQEGGKTVKALGQALEVSAVL